MDLNEFATRIAPWLKKSLLGAVLMGATSLVSAQPLESDQIFDPIQPVGHTDQVSFPTSSAMEHRLEALEKAFEASNKAEEKKKAASVDKPTLKVSGRLHLDVWTFPGSSPLINQIERGSVIESPEDRVQFRRMRLGAKGDLPGNMLYKIELEFAGGEDSQYRDAYLGWKDLPIFQTLLLGNQKRPYGLDHLNSSRYNVFMERPYVIEANNQDARRIGLCSYGVSDDLRYNWRYGLYMGEIAQSNAGPIGDPWQAEIAGRFANTIWYDECSDGRGYAHWAVAGTFADPATLDGDGRAPGAMAAGTGQHGTTADFRTRPEARTSQRWIDTDAIDFADTYQLLGFESVLNLGAFSVVAEYQNVWLQRQNGLDNLHFHGGYVYFAYFLTGEHTPWDRESGTLDRVKPFENFFLVDRCCGGVGTGLGAWQVACRLSHADYSDGQGGADPILGGVGDSVTFGLNWWWSPYARMQFNYIHGQIDQSRFATAATGPSGNYDILGARFMVDF